MRSPLIGRLKIVDRFRRYCKETELDVKDETLIRWMTVSYDRCCEWFGPPPDAGIRMVLNVGQFTGCARNRITRDYDIMISKTHDADEERFGAIAHEVYHRTTWQRWIHREPYLDELMAFVTEQELLRENGFAREARRQEWEARADKTALRGADLRCAKVIRRRLVFGGNVYPTGWYPGVRATGLDLVKRLGWERLSGLVRANNLAAWLNLLPESDRLMVETALGLDECER